MDEETTSYDGFSNYETWACFVLLTYHEATLRYCLEQAEDVRCESNGEREAAGERMRERLAERLRTRRLGPTLNGTPACQGEDDAQIAWGEIAASLLVEEPPVRTPRFPLGKSVVTAGALETLTPLDICVGVVLHSRGTWGEVDEEDAEENERGLWEDLRLFSAYDAKDGTRFYVVTECDRSLTTVLLADEY